MSKRTITIILLIFGMVFVVAGQTVGQTLQYIQNDKTVRTFQVDLKSASFSGNKITEVNGTASIINEKADFVAKGNLVVVEGWIALQGLKGSKFKLVPQLDIDVKPAERWYGEPSRELAVVTLGSDQQWELKDDRFFFLIDSSYGLRVDFSSSLARATKLIVIDQLELTLWGNKISVGEDGGIICIVRGEITGGKNIKVTRPDGKEVEFTPSLNNSEVCNSGITWHYPNEVQVFIKSPLDPSSNVTIEIKDIAQPLHRNARYTTVARIPKNTYKPWMMSKGSIFYIECVEFIRPKDKTFLEILILFKNQGRKEEKVEIHDVELEFPGGRTGPWEYLPAEVYNSYNYLAEQLCLSEKPPVSDIEIKLTFKGKLYCNLKPGEQTWLVMIFLVPKNLKEAKLIL